VTLRARVGRWLCAHGLHKWRRLDKPTFGTRRDSAFDVYCAREHCGKWLAD